MQEVRNLTPTTFETTQLAGQKRRRNRKGSSCVSCRRRKVGCDLKQPCQACIRYKQPETCHYGDDDEEPEDANDSRRSTLLNGISEYVEPDASSFDVQSRLDRMERKLDTLVEVISGQTGLPNGVDNDRSHTTTAREQERDNSTKGPQLQRAAAEQARSRQVYAEGSLCVKADRTVWIGSTGFTMAPADIISIWDPRNTFKDQWKALLDLGTNFTNRYHCTLQETAGIAYRDQGQRQHTMPSSQLLIDFLPEPSICEVLIERFLATFNVTHPIIEPSQLYHQYRSMMTDLRTASAKEHLFMLAVLAIGYQLPVIPPKGAAEIPNGQKEGYRLMSIVQNTLFSPEGASPRPSASDFRTLLCIIFSHKLELDWTDGNGIIYGLLGIAGRMAFTLGLHRDPSKNKHIPDDEAQSMRQLFVTYNLLELEHSVQSGMPFLLRQNDYDVDSPRPLSQGWPPYNQFFYQALPFWSDAVQVTHSTRNDRGPPVTNIEDGLDKIRLDFELSSNPDLAGELDEQERFTHKLQHCMADGLNHRLSLVLRRPKVDSEIEGTRRDARARYYDSASSILSYGNDLFSMIKTRPKPVRNAWAHFITALFRCTFLHAMTCILLLARRTMTDGPLERMVELRAATPSEAFQKIEEVLTIIGYTLPISREVIREHMMLKGYLRSVEERLRIRLETGSADLDLSSADGKLVILATQQTMDLSFQKATVAIERARNSSDPPPHLSTAPVQSSQPVADGGLSLENQLNAEDLAMLETWTADNDALLNGLDMQWPGLSDMVGF